MPGLLLLVAAGVIAPFRLAHDVPALGHHRCTITVPSPRSAAANQESLEPVSSDVATPTSLMWQHTSEDVRSPTRNKGEVSSC